MSEFEEITVKISSIVFSNKSTGFHVMKTSSSDGDVTVRGTFLGLNANVGIKAKFRGRFEQHAVYGKQFVSQSYEVIAENGRAGIVAYLINNVPSIGPVTASRLYDLFGDDLVKILESDPEKIHSATFLTKTQTSAILREWSEASESRITTIFLSNIGLTSSQIKKVWDALGPKSREIIQADPYYLYTVDGVGFVTADNAALQLDIGVDDIRRVRAVIMFAISELTLMEGHMYCTSDQIKSYIENRLFRRHSIQRFSHGEYIPDSNFYSSLVELSNLDLIYSVDGKIYLKSCWKHESIAAKRITEISVQPPYEFGDLDKILKEFEESKRISLSNEQREAFLSLGESRICVISGYPGTGKTFLVSAFVHLFEKFGLDYTLLSPTGIAAKRLSQVTNKNASTIHRALCYKPDGTWEFNAQNKYNADAILVDECCLPYKQHINLANGTKEHIGGVVDNKKSVEVLSFNIETGKVEPRKVVNWFRYELKNELFKITVSNSKFCDDTRHLQCTRKHKVYTSKGQVQASDLNIGDEVIVRGKFMTDIQKSFILGSSLSDSCHYVRAGNTHDVVFTHGDCQHEYINFKSQLFNSKVYESHYSVSTSMFLYKTDIGDLEEFGEIQKLIYIDGKKTITRKWLDMIDAIGLAAWYMDSGEVKKTGNFNVVCFHTESFSYKENNIITKWLKEKWKLDSCIHSDSIGDIHIQISDESLDTFFNVIRPYVISGMSHKIPDGICNFDPGPQSWKDVGIFRINDIEVCADLNDKYVYDIEVDHNHNYFSNDILVSNSMLDAATFYHLVTAIPEKTILVCVGDPAQLPSVGCGHVLNNLTKCEDVPHVGLTRIYRQEKQSDIITTAHSILRGETVNTEFNRESEFVFLNFSHEKILDEICKLTSLLKTQNKNFQVIAPVYDGDFGVNNLNVRLRDILNTDNQSGKAARIKSGDAEIFEGDRVMVVKNDYQRMIFNGDVGKVQRINLKSDEVEVKIFDWFDPDAKVPTYIDKIFTYKVNEARNLLRVAYACTAHRCQGNQYDYIIMPMTMQYGIMLYRNLIYTAITRAAKKVFIFGDPNAFEYAINNVRETHRNSDLSSLIQSGIENYRLESCE